MELDKLSEWEEKYRAKSELVNDALARRKYWLDHFGGKKEPGFPGSSSTVVATGANSNSMELAGSGGLLMMREYYEDNGPVGTKVEERKLLKIKDEVASMLTRSSSPPSPLPLFAPVH